jgi:DNA-binding response OmpR family regulator
MKRILIVDDDQTFLVMLSALLKRQGYEILTAFDGLDALVKIKENSVDLILLDIMMPELNGYDVCHYLRFEEKYKEIPIILLTARNQEMDKRMAKLIGIEYMQKPVDGDELMAKVEKMLGHS